jgi:hypothetical protein
MIVLLINVWARLVAAAQRLYWRVRYRFVAGNIEGGDVTLGPKDSATFDWNNKTRMWRLIHIERRNNTGVDVDE